MSLQLCVGTKHNITTLISIQKVVKYTQTARETQLIIRNSKESRDIHRNRQKEGGFI